MILSSISCLTVVSSAAVVDGGYEYGENDEVLSKYWELDDSGVLTIFADTTPTWLDHKDDIKKVVLEAGVTQIPAYAFSGCKNLVEIDCTKATYDLSVIGAHAFEDTGLKKLDTDAKLSIIDAYAFQNMSALNEVTLDYVGQIGEYAFYNCDNLTKVSIQGGLELDRVKKNIFKDCNGLTEVVFGNSCKEIGVGMFDDCTALVDVTLPDSLEVIGDLAFENCQSLKEIYIPDSVKTVGSYAYYDCISTETLYVGHSVESFGEYVFGNNKALKSATFKCKMPIVSVGMFYGCESLAGLVLPQGVISIGANAFKDCLKLTSIVIPNTVTVIGESAFDNSGLTEVTIPWNVVDIGLGAFTNCSDLVNIDVDAKNPDYASVDGTLYDVALNILICCPAGKTGTYKVYEGTTTIIDGAFIGCKDIQVVEIPDSVTTIADTAFNGCAEGLVIKAGCSSAAASFATKRGIALEAVHAEETMWVETLAPTCETAGVKEKRCAACEFVVETAAIDPIGHNYDEGVVTVSPTCDTDGVMKYSCVNEGCGSSYTKTIAALGHDYDNGTVILEATCDNDGIKRFRCKNAGCVSTYDIILPATGHSLDDGTVKIAATCESDGEIEYKCKDAECTYSYTDVIPAIGHKYNEGVVTTPATCENDGIKTFTCTRTDCGHSYTEGIPATGHNYDSGVITKQPTVNADGELTYTCKNEWCTEEHANHTFVVSIPNIMFDGIIATNDGAYADENGNIVNLEWFITDTYELYVLADDTAEEWAPYRNDIVSATISGKATTVTNGSFAEMPKLETANILLSDGTVEDYAFQECPELKTVITGSIRAVGDFAFNDCKKLEYLEIYGGLAEGEVGDNVFNGCESLSTVIIGNGSIELGYAMFKGCSALEEITLPKSVIVIGDSAFDGTSLKTIDITTDVKSIGKGAFTNCPALESINVDNKNDFYFSIDGVLYSMELGTLVHCPAAKTGEVKVWDNTESIAADAFIGCKGITMVEIPDSVTSIADNAFNNCADDLVIKAGCTSTAAAFAVKRGIALEAVHSDESKWIETLAPTCTTTGEKSRVCALCEYAFESVEIAALGHQYDSGVITKKATCDEDGVVTFTCVRTDCGEFYTEVLPKTEHRYDLGVVIVNPTCDTEGTKRFTCQNEGCYAYYDIPVKALGHSYDAGVVTTPATCETDGVMTFTCTRTDCGDSYTEVIPATGHAYDNGVVTTPATCDEDGVMTFTCANCGDTYTEVIPAIGHNYVETVVKVATCVEDGKNKFTCSNCGDSYEVATKGEHQLYEANVTVKPTCTEEGKTGKMCAICKQFVGAVDTVPALGHNYNNGTCSNCGDKDPDYKVVRPATPKMGIIRNEVKGITVTWSAVEGAKYYRVYRRGAGEKYWTYIGNVNTNSCLDTKATTGNYWRYTVRAVGETGLYSWYENGIYTKRVDTPHMKKLANTSKGISVTWTPVSNAKEYRVYRRGAGGTWSYIGTTTKTSFVDAGVKNAYGQYWRYTVRAVDGYYSGYESGIYTKRV